MVNTDCWSRRIQRLGGCFGESQISLFVRIRNLQRNDQGILAEAMEFICRLTVFFFWGKYVSETFLVCGYFWICYKLMINSHELAQVSYHEALLLRWVMWPVGFLFGNFTRKTDNKNKKFFRKIYAPHGAKFRFIFSVEAKPVQSK